MQIVAGAPKNVWIYKDCEISLQPTSAILVRIIISKVTNRARLLAAFANTPIRVEIAGYEDWNCVSWI